MGLILRLFCMVLNNVVMPHFCLVQWWSERCNENGLSMALGRSYRKDEKDSHINLSGAHMKHYILCIRASNFNIFTHSTPTPPGHLTWLPFISFIFTKFSPTFKTCSRCCFSVSNFYYPTLPPDWTRSRFPTKYHFLSYTISSVSSILHFTPILYSQWPEIQMLREIALLPVAQNSNA